MSTLKQEKDALLSQLKTALTLELGTIPPYLLAMLSIRPDGSRAAAEIIRSVMIEEMLHMTQVGNVTVAVGGAVEFSSASIPKYPLALDFEGKRFRDRSFDVDLAPFSPAVVETFLKIELPDGWRDPSKENEAPSTTLDIDGLTIGDFYRGIIHQLKLLCHKYGESAVFSGDPARQIGQDFYWSSGGKPVVVSNLESATRALQVVIHQGEGSRFSTGDGDHRYFDQKAEVAHFYRFREISFGKYYQQGDRPHQPPSGDSFAVDYAAVYPFKTNPRAADYPVGSELARLNRTFNRQYTLMLIQIQEAFSGSPRTLYTAIRNGMQGLANVATQMMEIPIPGDPHGACGAPTFEWVEPRLHIDRGDS